MQLDQAGLQRVIEQLRSSYVDSSALTNQEINQAAVEGLLSRLGPGASLETKTQTEQPVPNRPFKSELIRNAVWLRASWQFHRRTVCRNSTRLLIISAIGA